MREITNRLGKLFAERPYVRALPANLTFCGSEQAADYSQKTCFAAAIGAGYLKSLPGASEKLMLLKSSRSPRTHRKLAASRIVVVLLVFGYR